MLLEIVAALSFALSPPSGLLVISDPGQTAPPPPGQNCTVGPFTTSNQPTLAGIQAAINSAGNNAVICLQRGQAWSSGSRIAINTTHPNNSRVTICASTGNTCTRSGNTNPRITITSSTGCIAWVDGSSGSGFGGFLIQDIDCYNTASPNNAEAYGFGRWSHDITIDGGVVDSFFEPMSWQARCGAADGAPTNIKYGLCGGAGHWIEVRGGPASMPDQNRSFGYGACVNCNLSVYAHHWTSAGVGPTGNNHVGLSHMWDFGSWDTCDALTASSADITIECGQYEINGNNAFPNINGAAFKLWKGTRFIIRDNLFQDGSDLPGGLGSSGISAVGTSPHNIPAGHEGVTGGGVACAGISIYRNTFRGWGGFLNQIGSDICIFDNTFYFPNTSLSRGVYQNQKAPDAADQALTIGHTLVYNNTVFDSSTQTDQYAQLYGRDGGVPSAGQTLGTDNGLFNNLYFSTNPNIAAVVSAACSEFGTNGVNIKNNFVKAAHTPSVLWDTCSADTGNSTTFGTDPGLVNAPGEDFHPASGASPVCSFGSVPLLPATDKDQQAWDGANVGAFNCS